MFSKILVPLDGSMLSEKALPYALRLARQFEATVVLLRVVDLVEKLLPTNIHKKIQLTSEAAKYLVRLEQTLTKSENETALKPTQLQTHLCSGEAATEITVYATQCQADLILMTTHGRTGLGRLVTGSVAASVVRQSSVPVMLIHPFETHYDQLIEETLSGVGEPFSSQCFSGPGGRVLLTLDGSAASETALEKALDLANDLKATLHLLHINRPVTPISTHYLAGAGYYETAILKAKRDATRHAYAYLEYPASMAQNLTIPSVTVVTHSTDPALEIARYAEEIEASVIVIATHAPGEIERLFKGSVAESVVQHTHRPVLLVQTDREFKAEDELATSTN